MIELPHLNHKLTRLEKFSFKLTELMGSPFSLSLHTAIIIAALSLRYIGFTSNLPLVTVATIFSLEALYMAIFTQVKVNRNSRSLDEVVTNMEHMHDERKEIHKLTIQALHLSHQIKAIQHDLDLIKKRNLLKASAPQIRARAHA